MPVVVIQVYDSRIDAWNFPGGMIYRWLRTIDDEVVLDAIARCPKRTGHLASTIRGTVAGNQYGVFAKVYADAHYASYVHEGTHTPIVPTTANYLKWNGWGIWARPKPWRRPEVRGQASQPFLREALRDVLRLHHL